MECTKCITRCCKIITPFIPNSYCITLNIFYFPACIWALSYTQLRVNHCNWWPKKTYCSIQFENYKNARDRENNWNNCHVLMVLVPIHTSRIPWINRCIFKGRYFLYFRYPCVFCIVNMVHHIYLCGDLWSIVYGSSVSKKGHFWNRK